MKKPSGIRCTSSKPLGNIVNQYYWMHHMRHSSWLSGFTRSMERLMKRPYIKLAVGMSWDLLTTVGGAIFFLLLFGLGGGVVLLLRI